MSAIPSRGLNVSDEIESEHFLQISVVTTCFLPSCANTYTMSRGLGRIEWQIQKSILKEQMRIDGTSPCVHISSWNVVIDVFHPGYANYEIYRNWEPSRAQKLAVSRAMNSFVRKFPQFALMGGQGRKRLYLYDTTNPESIAWAKASVKSRKMVARCEVKNEIGLSQT